MKKINLRELTFEEKVNIEGGKIHPMELILSAAKSGWEFGNWLGAKLYGNN